ncbi:hypothetical protein PCANC_17691 [Puccinia coronata f. sp. avenae]|uniref:Uncharacterized protein n=1 Tax=Puccinia coronata f. sp. avenae TaxID=200324 RepID=A0A2N5U961_9BASI|nr:hypothetical protein PCANC_17691 [Puccinia coronata f. sp. avenae]
MALPNDNPIILLGALSGVGKRARLLLFGCPTPRRSPPFSTAPTTSSLIESTTIHHSPLVELLYPTITTKGFTTKLYHINGLLPPNRFTYLTDLAISPLANKFIEIDCPLCTGALWKKTATSGRGEVNHNDVPVVGAI